MKSITDPQECTVAGVRFRPLMLHADTRGSVVEVFSTPWSDDLRLPHWAVFRSCPNVLRGVRVHVQHTDYLVMISGRMYLGLCDLRESAPTYRASCLVELREDVSMAVVIPPGVAHGEYFPVASTHLHASSHLYDAADDLYCRWNDPGLGIPWGPLEPTLSRDDEKAGSLEQLQQDLRRSTAV
jgi:dTDP-4-dehydrorhamnose 3,5-epimerase